MQAKHINKSNRDGAPRSSDFDSFRLDRSLLKNVTAAGYEIPTPIQSAAIPSVMKGNDLVGCAQTGTGKTAAFALPILHRLLSDRATSKPRIRALVLAPTRELAAQIEDSFSTFARGTRLRSTVIFGGVKKRAQLKALAVPPAILVATPGRLLDLMSDRALTLSEVEYVVLDEADRMLDMGFIHDVRKIMRAVPSKRQTMLFSATMPREIENLARQFLDQPQRVSVAPVASSCGPIEQSVYFVEKPQKTSRLISILRDAHETRTLVFTRTKHGANKVVKQLVKAGISAAAIHGNKSQSAREAALASFKRGATRVLVATDLASRGIDIEQLPLVINFDLPNEPEVYVHRIGRTGRAGAAGTALSFCSGEERPFLKSIERLIKKQIARSGSEPAPAESSQHSSSPAAATVANRSTTRTRPRRSHDGPRSARPSQHDAVPAGNSQNPRRRPRPGAGKPRGGNARPSRRPQNRANASR